MEVGRDKNQEASDKVKENPGDGQAEEHAEGGLEPFRSRVRRADRGWSPPETVGA